MPPRGRAIVANRSVGLCLLCHSGPIAEERFQGNLAPSLAGAGARWSVAQLRLRIVDGARLNPDTIMPPYYRTDRPAARRQDLRGQDHPDGRADRGCRGLSRDPEGLTDEASSRRRRTRLDAPSSPALPCVSVLPFAAARATPEAMAAAIKEVVGRRRDPRRPGDARPAAAGRERQHRAAHRVGRKPDERGRPRQGDPRLQREEPAAACLRRPASARATARP